MDYQEKIKTMVRGPLLEEAISIRRHLHRHPELSFKEYNTSAFIRELLDSWDIEYHHPFVETGILASIRGKRNGKCVAVRTDMDALPIQEASGVDFPSVNPGVMHACGHDVHMASVLGAIRVLDQLRDHLEGELLFLFQPGEEKVPGGARLMLEEGVFEERKPDLIIAQHVLPEMEAGKVGFREGLYMASSDEVYITVKGRGGHAALQDQIRDPVQMASRILTALKEEIQGAAPDGVPAVLSFGKVVADGAVNVIPDQVLLEGTFRTLDEGWRKKAHRLIGKIASGIAAGMGGGCSVEIRHGYPVLHNDERITRIAMERARQFLGNDRVEELEIRMTAEDFAWFAQTVPGVMYRLGIRSPGQDQVYPLHTSGFRIDESALETGISLIAFLAAEMLREPAG